MRIEIITAFNDLTRPETDRRVEIGEKQNVTAERGEELVGLGIAKKSGEDTPDIGAAFDAGTPPNTEA